MRIYTRTGDKGETGLVGGARVGKQSRRIRAYGEIDELNAAIGMVRAAGPDRAIDAILHSVQEDLFEVGSVLASPGSPARLQEERVGELEGVMDRFDPNLPRLKNFILPGGKPAGAALHLARTVCRRAEREVVALAAEESVPPDVLRYLNRLSDLLFVLARVQNQKDQVQDVVWKPKAHIKKASRRAPQGFH